MTSILFIGKTQMLLSQFYAEWLTASFYIIMVCDYTGTVARYV